MARANWSAAAMWARGQLGRGQGRQARLIFGQVREDPAAELLVLQALGPEKRVFCIASGGCTAFALLTAQPAHVTACDINPAQVALVELKKAVLLQTPNLEARQAAFWVDGRPALAEVEPLLPEPARLYWAQNGRLLRRGLQNAGLVDGYLRWAVRLFHGLVHRARTTRRLLSFTDLPAQQAYFQRYWQTWRWRACFRLLDARGLLRFAYGRAILQQLPPDFAAQVQEQVERPLRQHPAADNAYAWHFWLPEEVAKNSSLQPVFLTAAAGPMVQAGLPRLQTVVGNAVDVLARTAEPFDFIALSNILELADPVLVEQLMPALVHATRPGARVMLRFFFPPPAWLLAALAGHFTREPALEARCQATDRGMFCTNFVVLRRI